MPIKFRCHHCRQFLGISRAMAEKVVDCPSCGRTIRVPDLEGNVAPVPQPKLDLADSSLVEALDRLASIGSVPGLVLADSETPSDESGLSEDTFEPVALEGPQPIPVPSPEPRAPVVVEPPTPVPPEGVSAPPPRVEYQPDALSSLATAPASAAPANGSRTTLLLVAAVMGLLGALIGLVAARYLLPPAVVSDGTGRENQQPAEGERPATKSDPSMSGTVTYRTETGDKPDKGARVIALPTGDAKRGTVKIPIQGLRPGDSVEDFDVVRNALVKRGGSAAIVDENGEFALDLPAPGTYQLVVLSHYQRKDADETMPPSVVILLDEFLDRPSQLVGQGRFELARIRWQGEGTDPIVWSHTFTPAES